MSTSRLSLQPSGRLRTRRVRGDAALPVTPWDSAAPRARGAQGAPPRRLPWPPDSPPFVLASALPPQAPLHAHAPRLRMAVRVAGVCLSHSRRDPVGPGAERPSPVPALPRRAPDPDPPPTARLLLCRAGRARWRVSEVPPATVACGSAPTSPDRVQRHGSFKHPSPTRSGSSGSVQSL